MIVAVSRAAAECMANESNMVDAESCDGVCEYGDGVVVCKVELAVGVSAISDDVCEEGRGVTHLAMLRWTKTSPGFAARTTDSGTRESAHPIQRSCGRVSSYAG